MHALLEHLAKSTWFDLSVFCSKKQELMANTCAYVAQLGTSAVVDVMLRFGTALEAMTAIDVSCPLGKALTYLSVNPAAAASRYKCSIVAGLVSAARA